MRKGRSQRKTRSSLPPLSGRSQPSRVGAEASPASPGPQVVIGITGRPSEVEKARETRGAAPASDLATKPSARIDRVEVAPEPVLGTVSGPVLQAVDREPLVDSLAPAVVSEDSSAHEVVSDPFALGLRAETPRPPSTETSELEAEAGPSPHVLSVATPGEPSIPPAGDLSVEPIAERFFSEGELASGRDDANDAESWAAAPDNVQRKSLPHVVERRARFSRYVRWAVSSAAVVCLAALAQTALVPHRASTASAGTAMAAIPVEAVQVAAPVAPSAAVTVTGADSVEAPRVDVPPKADAPKTASVEATKPEEPKAPGAEPEPPKAATATAGKTALEEKTDARRKLERGNLADAIAAGERSVALDPQDGEAWLLLGAAYQEKGNNADARRCYKACISEGKRGPLGECRAMVH